MTNTFVNASNAISSSGTVIYTCPSATTAVIHSVFISNVSASSSDTIEIKMTSSARSSTYHIGKNIPIAVGSSLILDKPIVLQASDTLTFTSGANSTLEATLGILQIS